MTPGEFDTALGSDVRQPVRRQPEGPASQDHRAQEVRLGPRDLVSGTGVPQHADMRWWRTPLHRLRGLRFRWRPPTRPRYSDTENVVQPSNCTEPSIELPLGPGELKPTISYPGGWLIQCSGVRTRPPELE